MNLSRPAVTLISVGAGQSSGWDLPRIDVVESVLLARATACITAPATEVFQTEEGSPAGSLTSIAGYCVGDIAITTDGVSTFTVSANGAVNQGPNELASSGLPKTFHLDDLVGPPLSTIGRESRPASFRLYQNHPNPLNPRTAIRFDLAHDALVKLAVYDILGKERVRLVDGRVTAGNHEVFFDGTLLASGVYYYRLEIKSIPDQRQLFAAVRKMILLK